MKNKTHKKHHLTRTWIDHESQAECSESYLPQKTANGLPKYAIRAESFENGSFTMSFVRCDTSRDLDKLSRGIVDEDIFEIFSESSIDPFRMDLLMETFRVRFSDLIEDIENVISYSAWKDDDNDSDDVLMACARLRERHPMLLEYMDELRDKQ